MPIGTHKKPKALYLSVLPKILCHQKQKKAIALACNALESLPLSEMRSSLIDGYFDPSVDRKITEKYHTMAQSVGASSAVSQYQIILKQNEPFGGLKSSNIPTLILHEKLR